MSGQATWVRPALIAVAVAYVAILLLGPLAGIIATVATAGIGVIAQTLTADDVLHAFWLTAIITILTVLVTGVFGIITALVLTRDRFVGRRLISGIVDLPLAVSPVIVGVMAVILFGRGGWLEPFFAERGIQIIFAVPSMTLVTMFICIPFVIRELTPVLQELGTVEEDAARTLGASSLQAFFRVTLPNIRWALLYGIALTDRPRHGRDRRRPDRERGDPGTDRDRHPVHLPSARGTAGRVRVRRGAHPGARVGDPAGRHRDSKTAPGAPQGANMTAGIVVENLTKRFGSFTAVDDVSFVATKARSPPCWGQVDRARARCSR